MASMLCPPLALGLSLALVGCGWSVTTARSGCTRAFGLFTVESGSAQPLAEYSKVESSINAHSAIVHEFVGLTEPSTSSSLAAAVARKSLPFVDIEADSVPDPLHTINAGRADADIDRWGRDLAALRHPVMIAPLAEMDEADHLYGYGVRTDTSGHTFTNTAADIVTAYRRIHDRISARGATNVIWVYNPAGEDVKKADGAAMELFYPGDGYVDWVGLDPYNWYKSANWAPGGLPWESMKDLLAVSRNNPGSPGLYARVTTMAPGKPLMLAEWGGTEGDAAAPQTKAQWMTEAGRDLANDSLFPALKAVVYFNQDAWRFDTTPQSLTAARQAFGAGSHYCLTADQVAVAHIGFAPKR